MDYCIRKGAIVEFAITVLSSAGVSSALAVVLAFLARSWIGERLKTAIKHEYDQKLESYKEQLRLNNEKDLSKFRSDMALSNTQATERLKADLESANARSIEGLRSKLQIAAAEQQIRYSKLHEDTASVIAHTYERLWNINKAVYRYIKDLERQDDPPKAERREAVSGMLAEFQTYFTPRSLYLPPKVAAKVMNVFSELDKITVKFFRDVERKESQMDTSEAWVAVLEHHKVVMPGMFADLEDEFRGLLGFPPETKANSL